MGLLTLFSKSPPTLLSLPSGSFTVDRQGRVLVGTLPSSFPAELIDKVAQQVLATFREAAAAQLPLSTLSVHYASLTITARELRGGAIIYFNPKAPAALNN